MEMKYSIGSDNLLFSALISLRGFSRRDAIKRAYEFPNNSQHVRADKISAE